MAPWMVLKVLFQLFAHFLSSIHAEIIWNQPMNGPPKYPMSAVATSLGGSEMNTYPPIQVLHNNSRCPIPYNYCWQMNGSTSTSFTGIKIVISTHKFTNITLDYSVCAPGKKGQDWAIMTYKYANGITGTIVDMSRPDTVTDSFAFGSAADNHAIILRLSKDPYTASVEFLANAFALHGIPMPYTDLLAGLTVSTLWYDPMDGDRAAMQANGWDGYDVNSMANINLGASSPMCFTDRCARFYELLDNQREYIFKTTDISGTNYDVFRLQYDLSLHAYGTDQMSCFINYHYDTGTYKILVEHKAIEDARIYHKSQFVDIPRDRLNASSLYISLEQRTYGSGGWNARNCYWDNIHLFGGVSGSQSPTSGTISPSFQPTSTPSMHPISNPSISPSANPSIPPSDVTAHPSIAPSGVTANPSIPPSDVTAHPSIAPSRATAHPSLNPSVATAHPSLNPSTAPSGVTANPSIAPPVVTPNPSIAPSDVTAYPTQGQTQDNVQFTIEIKLNSCTDDGSEPCAFDVTEEEINAILIAHLDETVSIVGTVIERDTVKVVLSMDDFEQLDRDQITDGIENELEREYGQDVDVTITKNADVDGEQDEDESNRVMDFIDTWMTQLVIGVAIGVVLCIFTVLLCCYLKEKNARKRAEDMLKMESTVTHAVTTKTDGVELTNHDASPGKNVTGCQDSGDMKCQDNELQDIVGVLPGEEDERGEESQIDEDGEDRERSHSEDLYDTEHVVETKGTTKGGLG